MTHGAQIALHAITLIQQQGKYAARRYAEKRGCGSLYRMARQLNAVREL